MILDLIKKSEAALSTIQAAIYSLDEVSFFSALVELGMRRARTLFAENPSSRDCAALAGAWQQGYQSAIEDIYSFSTQARLKLNTPRAPFADFGAIGKLLEDGEITEDESIELRKSL